VNNFDANYSRNGGNGDYYKLVMFPCGEVEVATNARIFITAEGFATKTRRHKETRRLFLNSVDNFYCFLVNFEGEIIYNS